MGEEPGGSPSGERSGGSGAKPLCAVRRCVTEWRWKTCTVGPVVAGQRSWGQPDPGGAGEGGSSPDNAGTGQYRHMVWVRLARSRGTGVPRMQAKLHRWVVADPGRRFDDVFNFVHHPATLLAAFDRVASNAGANTPGSDGLTVRRIDEEIGSREAGPAFQQCPRTRSPDSPTGSFRSRTDGSVCSA
jgi:hypothetical protein